MPCMPKKHVCAARFSRVIYCGEPYNTRHTLQNAGYYDVTLSYVIMRIATVFTVVMQIYAEKSCFANVFFCASFLVLNF